MSAMLKWCIRINVRVKIRFKVMVRVTIAFASYKLTSTIKSKIA